MTRVIVKYKLWYKFLYRPLFNWLRSINSSAVKKGIVIRVKYNG